MAGGYQQNPAGVEGLAAKFKDLQRQIDAIRQALGLQSAIIGKGGLTVKDGGSITIQDDGGITIKDGGGIDVLDDVTGARMSFGDGSIAIWDDYNANPDGFGRIYCDPGSGWNYFRLFPPYSTGDGLQNAITIQGSAPGDPGNLWLTTDGQMAFEAGGRAVMTADIFDVIAGSKMRLYGIPTTSGSANLRLDIVDGEPLLKYNTSSMRYKQDVEDAGLDPAAVLRWRPRTWRDKAEVAANPATTKRYIGFIAEEVEAAGTPELVEYDDDGRPNSLSYDRMAAGLHAVATDHETQIAELKATVATQAEVNATQAQLIADLTARLAALEAA